MNIGYIGLGKMGYNMTLRLKEKGYEVTAFDVNKDAREQAEKVGIPTADSLEALVNSLSSPRLIWIMVPYKFVDNVLADLAPRLAERDTIIEGGNSPFKDSMRRAKELAAKNIDFIDVGVSGGPNGARDGASLMVGGTREKYDELETLFRDLAVPDGYGYMGPSGAGHFVKMVHNGIEYGIMQSIAEGFTIMKNSKRFNLDMIKIARVYNHGSVIESRLMGWMEDAFREFGPDLKSISGSVRHSGEAQWTIDTAHELGVPDEIIHKSLEFREESEDNPSYTGKILSALRNMFGGHKATKE